MELNRALSLNIETLLAQCLKLFIVISMLKFFLIKLKIVGSNLITCIFFQNNDGRRKIGKLNFGVKTAFDGFAFIHIYRIIDGWMIFCIFLGFRRTQKKSTTA